MRADGGPGSPGLGFAVLEARRGSPARRGGVSPAGRSLSRGRRRQKWPLLCLGPRPWQARPGREAFLFLVSTGETVKRGQASGVLRKAAC